jgi:O-antigen ligase
MDFIFLALAAAAMYLSPASIWPELEAVQIYLPLIVLCLMFSFPAVLNQLSIESLTKNPMTFCVLALIPAILISLVLCSDFYEARVFTWGFAKTCVYYLLVVGVVNTPARFRRFLWLLLAIIVLVVAIGVLDYFQILRIPGIRQFQQKEYNRETGEKVAEYLRLRSVNFFHDPSSLALLMTTGVWITFYLMAKRGAWGFRLVGVGILGFFGWAFTLTAARGGFTALVAGCTAFLLTRFGHDKKKAIALGAILIPILFLAFAGRATHVNLEEEDDRGARIDIWSRGIPCFKESPIFGIGADHYFDEVGHQAHNAFWEAYVDLGIIGGSIFLGISYFAMCGLVHLRKWGSEPSAGRQRSAAYFGNSPYPRDMNLDWSKERKLDSELIRFRPYLMAILVSHLLGMFTQPLTYQVPIYTVYGLIAAYFRLATAHGFSTSIEFDRRQLKWLMVTSIAFLICFYIFVRAAERLA